MQQCPFDLFGWVHVLLVHVGMYWFILHKWHQDLRGCGGVLSFSLDGVVSSYAGSCFLYFTKVMAFF